MRDREQRLGMADSLIEFEQTPVEPERFVIEAITDVGEAMRWSVRPAEVDRNLLIKDPAKALSRVKPDDPKLRLRESDIISANPEILPLATSLLVGKVRRVEEDIPLSPKEKSALRKFEDKVLEGTTKILAGIGGKRAVTGISTLTLLATACSSAINPPLPEPTPTEVPVASSTEIAPSPTEETENIVVISQRLMTGEEVFAAGGEELRQAYLDFQEEVKLREGLDNASFEAWGIETKTIDGGSIVSPFFEVNDPEEGNSLSMVIQLEAGGFRAIALEPLEVIVDGKTYLTLSLTKNAETLENLLTPEPIFWIPVSLAEWNGLTQEQRASLSVMFNGLGGIVTETQPLDGGKVAAIRAVMTPTVTPELTPTEVPPPYEIVEGYKEEVREETLSVPVSIDIITDESLQDRHPVNHPIERLFLNTERFPNASQDISEATMRAIWYAWKDDAPDERDSVTFENYMEMVKEYIDGERPLSDVEYQVWANDLQTAVFKTEVFSFDPTQPIKIVYLDELATENISYVSPGNRSGIQRNSDGNLEIWLAYPKDRIRYSFWSTILCVQSLNRLTWPAEYQGANPKRIDGSEAFYDPSKYHSDVYNKLIRTTTSSGWGVIAPDPNDWD